MRNRLVNPSKIRRSEQELVLLDENLLKCMCLNYHALIPIFFSSLKHMYMMGLVLYVNQAFNISYFSCIF